LSFGEEGAAWNGGWDGIQTAWLWANISCSSGPLWFTSRYMFSFKFSSRFLIPCVLPILVLSPRTDLSRALALETVFNYIFGRFK